MSRRALASGDVSSTSSRRSAGRVGPRHVGRLAFVLLVGVTASLALVAGTDRTDSTSATTEPVDSDWLSIVNSYRGLSGLAPVSPVATWAAEAREHSCAMVRDGVVTHDGSDAGRNGNVAASPNAATTARDFIDLWMTGPFHAIGLLRPGLTRTGYGECSDATASPWRSAATIDVLRGIDPSVAQSAPVVFPGNGSRIALDRFVSETPNPAAMCGYGDAGLPLLALMPRSFSSASATLRGPDGALPTCVLHPGNTTGTASSILGSGNGVVVMTPRRLVTGSYTASVITDSGSATWSFEVDPDARLGDRATPLTLPDTVVLADPGPLHSASPARVADSRRDFGLRRLRGGRTTRFHVVDDPSVTAVAANFTVTRAADAGYLTAYDCGGDLPTTATVNFTSAAVQNLGIIPVRHGEICLFPSVDLDIVIDVNGFVRLGGEPDEAAGLHPFEPVRLLDTRSGGGGRFRAGETRRIRVAGVGGIDPISSAATLTVTSVGTAAQSYLTVWDCSTSQPPETSAGNVAQAETRANATIVDLSTAGDVCIYSHAAADIVVDVSGDFGIGRGLEMVPLSPIRLLDTRSPDEAFSGGTAGERLARGSVTRIRVAGERGIPASARAATLNLSSIRPSDRAYVTAYPCQGSPPGASSLNHAPDGPPVVANAVTVALDSSGDVCIYSSAPTHLTVDITGAWS